MGKRNRISWWKIEIYRAGKVISDGVRKYDKTSSFK